MTWLSRKERAAQAERNRQTTSRAAAEAAFWWRKDNPVDRFGFPEDWRGAVQRAERYL